MTTEYLKGPSNSYGTLFGTVVGRQPLVYSPSSSAEVNRARLPSPDQLRDMELAYREQFYSDEQLASIVNTRLLFVYLGSLAITLFIALIGTVLPVQWALYAAGALSILLGINAIVRRGASTQRMVLIVAVPAVLVALSSFLVALMDQRLIGGIVLAVLTLLIFQFQGANSFAFYKEWLHAAPRNRSSTRRNPVDVPTKPDMLLLAGILAIAVIVPIWSPALAIAGVLAVSLVFAGDLRHPVEFLKRIRMVFGQYLTYGSVSNFAPGGWMPDASLSVRSLNAWRLMLPLALTLATGLHFFAPWDVLRWSIASNYEEGTVGLLLTSPFEWVFAAMPAISDGDPTWLWLFPVALALSVVIPLLVFAAVYRKPLSAAVELEARIHGTGSDAIDHDPSRCERDW